MLLVKFSEGFCIYLTHDPTVKSLRKYSALLTIVFALPFVDDKRQNRRLQYDILEIERSVLKQGGIPSWFTVMYALFIDLHGNVHVSYYMNRMNNKRQTSW